MDSVRTVLEAISNDSYCNDNPATVAAALRILYARDERLNHYHAVQDALEQLISEEEDPGATDYYSEILTAMQPQ